MHCYLEGYTAVPIKLRLISTNGFRRCMNKFNRRTDRQMLQSVAIVASPMPRKTTSLAIRPQNICRRVTHDILHAI